MKTAIYIKEDRLQVVLSPENDFERNIVSMFTQDCILTTQMGSFYQCRGGWTRHGEQSSDALILVLDKEPEAGPKVEVTAGSK